MAANGFVGDRLPGEALATTLPSSGDPPRSAAKRPGPPFASRPPAGSGLRGANAVSSKPSGSPAASSSPVCV